jgi:hypothetical protein
MATLSFTNTSLISEISRSPFFCNSHRMNDAFNKICTVNVFIMHTYLKINFYPNSLIAITLNLKVNIHFVLYVLFIFY